jgi:hypothetical protein
MDLLPSLSYLSFPLWLLGDLVLGGAAAVFTFVTIGLMLDLVPRAEDQQGIVRAARDGEEVSDRAQTGADVPRAG